MPKTSRQTMLPGMDENPAPARTPAEQPKVASHAVPGVVPATVLPPSPVIDGQPWEPASLDGKKVWVIDANSLIFQVFHAIPEMTSPQGLPVSAVFGFTRDLLFLLESQQPDFVFVAFDTKEPTFRHELYTEYKGTRTEIPVDLVPQFPLIQQIVRALGLGLLEAPGFEADDILATLAERTEKLGGECFLVSGDKDIRQLISDRVKIYNLRKNQVIDEQALASDWGIKPDQVVDYQTLVGDSVDNIPGVPLIGPKTASEWLQKFGSLDDLLARASIELPASKRRDNLLASREQISISRQLCLLDRHMPLAFDWHLGQTGRYDEPLLFRLFAELGFHSFGARVSKLPHAGRAPAAEAHPVSLAEYHAITTQDELAAFITELQQQPRFSFDTETAQAFPHAVGSVWPRWSQIVGYSFAWQDGKAYYLPVRAPEGTPHVSHEQALDALRPALEDPEIEKVGQNLKYDMVVLRSAGVQVQGAAFDTMVASYLIDAGERNHSLDELAQRYLGHETIKISSLIGTGKSQKRMDEVPLETITRYAAEDADIAWRLSTPLAAGLKQAGLDKLFHEVEMPLVEVLTELETNGITVDVPLLNRLSQQFGEHLARLEQEIYSLAGHPFNINSVKQLQEVLFDELNLPVIKKTQTGRSTDVEVLEELATKHPLPAKLLDYRQYNKLKGTYIDALPTMVHPGTGRVHASFRQDVAATGRLSSENPNLQNIPIRTEAGREIRNAFIPGQPGWQLLAADYSQIELRVLAHYSGDEALCQAFANDEDIHARVAAQVYGVPLADVSSTQRRNAKAVNFGIIYGQSPFGLAKGLGISKDDAAEFIDRYFAQYKGVESFMNGVLVECAKTGYVHTILGRRRAITGVRTTGSRQRNLPERTAINTVIQGSAADIIKLAMIAVHRRLATDGHAARMLLQIHDELVLEAPSEELQTVGQMLQAEMAGAMQLKVPLKVDVKSGPNWGACEAW
jgi:DNA polymerase-1